MSYYGWSPYVPVAVRRAQAKQEMTRMQKEGLEVQPVEIEGRKIAHTFWGQAWCDHLESLGDFASRLPRGRTYVRNGSVCHLAMERGQIKAIVSGSELYNVVVKIDTLSEARWNQVKRQCSGHIGSLLELLEGRISTGVMEVVTDPDGGLFPQPSEIHFDCDCPDWAMMCKHVAAVLYGVGARLDQRPETLFQLRGVDHLELITASEDDVLTQATKRKGDRRRVAAAELSDVFGVELEGSPNAEAREVVPTGNLKRTPARRKGTTQRGPKTAVASPKSVGVGARRSATKKAARPANQQASSGAAARAPKKHK